MRLDDAEHGVSCPTAPHVCLISNSEALHDSEKVPTGELREMKPDAEVTYTKNA